MLKGLKDYLVPHEGNDHKSHIFREASVLLALFLIVFLFATSFGSHFVVKYTNILGNVESAVLVDLTNRDRLSNGEATLTVSPLLTQAAEMKAKDMAEKSYFAHTSPEGLTPWHWFEEVNYPFSYAGENLAIDFQESESVEQAWLASPKHRENIMNTNFTEIGIATYKGMYNGHETTYVVQMFGKPKKAKVAVVKTTTTKTATTETLASAIGTQPEIKSEVKGEEIEVVEETPVAVEQPVEVTETAPTPQYQVLQEDEKNIVVQDISSGAEEETAQNTPVNTAYQSTFLQRVFVNQPRIVDYAYKILMAIVAIGLVFYIGHELRADNRKHVIYGVLLLVILLTLVYINQTFILTDQVLM